MGLLVKVYTFVPNTTAHASEVNRNFDDLFNGVNGNLDSANIKSTYTINASNVTLVDAAAQFSSCHVEAALYEMKVTLAGLSGATIQDFSQGLIGNVGSACQQFAGHIWALNEPNTTATEVIALYSFCATTLYNDVCNTYNFTPASNAPVTTSGIMGLDNAVYFSGATGSYLYNNTLLNASMSAMCIDWWMAPVDGNPTTCQNTIFYKFNNTANATEDRLYCYYNSEGTIKTYLFANGSGHTIVSNYAFVNGTCSHTYLCLTQDTANGLRLFVNGALDCFNLSATQGMRAGTASPFYVGVSYGSATNTIANPYQGTISQLRIRNKLITQKDVDVAFATRYTKPVSPDGLEVDIRAQVQPSALSECQRLYGWDNVEVCRNSSTVYRLGGIVTDLSATDRLKIFVRS